MWIYKAYRMATTLTPVLCSYEQFGTVLFSLFELLNAASDTL